MGRSGLVYYDHRSNRVWKTTYDEREALWIRDEDGAQLADTHDRNFIRTPDEVILAIDVQPRLLAGFKMDEVTGARV